jgi:hypothetical protein
VAKSISSLFNRICPLSVDDMHYSIQSDGTLANKQKYYWLHSPDTADDAGAEGLRTDRDGRLYVATGMAFRFVIRPVGSMGFCRLPMGR